MENEADKSSRWFVLLAHIFVPTAMVLPATYVFQQTSVGKFPWWPYPAFTLFCALVFVAYGILESSKKDSNNNL